MALALPISRHRTRRLLVGRRTFLLSVAGMFAGFGQAARAETLSPAAFPRARKYPLAGIYAAIPDERFPIPAVDVRSVEPQYLRQRVAYATRERPGTIVVDPNERFLYLVLENGQALRYGVGVGREGFGWSGRAIIQRKARWPTWTPPRSMIARQPELARYANGMAPGLENPLGARALYLYENGRDALYRLHGTNEPRSIGRAVSSGCIRLFNQDIIDLFLRTPVGTEVVVLEHGGPPSAKKPHAVGARHGDRS